MNIGLFGGSFDPIHNGHLALVRDLAATLLLDRVILMPTGHPPHKIKKTATTDEERLTMCRLAVAGDPLITVSDFEIVKGGASFTVDTLEALHREYPDDRLFLLMGADMFLSLSAWKRVEDIVKLAVLCAVPRDDASIEDLLAYATQLEAMGAQCRITAMPPMPLSSTHIRDTVKAGGSLDGMVPETVAEYIACRGLYTDAACVDENEQFRQIIKARLLPDRYAHSLAVAEEARRLAVRYGVDPDKAYTAGLLHDIMKNTKCDTQLQILKDFDILLDTVEQQTQKLWHAKSGAAFIERVLGVTDPEIVTAVRYHTTGRAGMSALERVLFLADFTSADRDYPDVQVMRRLVDEDETEAMLYALGYTISDLVGRRLPVHPDTVNAYNEMTLKRSEK